MTIPERPEEVNFTSYTCEEYAQHLAAREPIPGGGGAAAMTGALGIALASMAGAFAVGKPRYAAYEKDLVSHSARAERLRRELLELVNEDSRQFLLVSDAFAISRDDPSRAQRIEEALIAAAKPPLRVMEVICETIALLEEMQVKGSRLLLSDVGCGAALSRGALEAASHTVFVNTRSMQDRAYAASVNEQATALMDTWIPRAEALSRHVSKHLQGEA